jgi:hypothetical protein
MLEIVRSMEKEVEAREMELNSWRDRYQSVKKSYDEQLCIPPHNLLTGSRGRKATRHDINKGRRKQHP